MILDSDYVRVSDLFEDTVRRAEHLASLASVLQDAIASPDSIQKHLYNTSWLLSALLQDHCNMIMTLQDAHRKDFVDRHSK